MANRYVPDRPNCLLKCSVCKYPDCIYDGDYVSLTEQRAADRQDRRAIHYRLSWEELNRLRTKQIDDKRRYKRKNTEKTGNKVEIPVDTGIYLY